MTAGTGINHSEFNYGKKPVHLFQIWIQPNKHGLQPNYRQLILGKKFGGLQLIASHEKRETALQLNANARVFLAKFEKSKEIEFTPEFEKTFIYAIGGKISIAGKILEQGFQARISGEKRIKFKALQKSDFLLIDVSD